MTSAASRILVIGPSNIGDAILASDVIAVLHEQHPHAHLTLVVGSRACALFTEDPRIQTLMDADRYDSAMGRVRLLFIFWRYQPQLVVDLRHTLYPILLHPLRGWRLFRRPPAHLVHMRDRHRWTLYAQTSQLQESASRGNGRSLWWSPKDVTHVEMLWRRWGLQASHPLIIVCPGARSHIKRWTTAGFAHVADRLIGDYHAQIVFSGEPDEKSIVDDVLGLMRHRAHSAVGLTTIRQVGVLMQRAHLVITNDSASLHLASAVNVPTVAIFGPTDAAKYGPTASRYVVIRRRLFCAPCEQALCRFHHECMRFVSAEEVFTAAKTLVEEGRRQATRRPSPSRP